METGLHWELFRRVVETRMSDIALVELSSNVSFSFKALYSAAIARANLWIELGVQRKDKMLFRIPNSGEWLVTYLALQKLRAVAVPVDVDTPDPALESLAENVQAHWIWDGFQLRKTGAGIPYETDDVCLIKVTSGSSGIPQVMPFLDVEMLADGQQICRTMGIIPSDINYALIPIGHSYGLGNLLMPLLIQGTSLVCASAVLPHVIAGDILRSRATVFPSVPVVFKALIQAAVEPASLSSLRLLISAGAPLKQELYLAFAETYNRPIHNFYGSSETGGIAYDVDGSATAEGQGVGTLMDGVIAFVDSDRHLVVRSKAVFSVGNITPNEWTLGDLASLSANGMVSLLGRSSDVVKLDGRRISLSEVACAMEQIEGVAEVWVTLLQHKRDFLGAVAATALSPQEISRALQSLLPKWKIPRRICCVPALPKTERGKNQKEKLLQILER
ncbi:MAG: acyl--CoA ligase [Opitutales bacterium]|nr:acyl--CoA ligase [Opitutales bacterium]